jgi:hypothetical protein
MLLKSHRFQSSQTPFQKHGWKLLIALLGGGCLRQKDNFLPRNFCKSHVCRTFTICKRIAQNYKSGYSKKRNIIPVWADFFSWFGISVSRKPSKLNIKFIFSNFLLPPSFLLQESTVKKTPDLTGRKTCTLRAWTYTYSKPATLLHTVICFLSSLPLLPQPPRHC